MTNPSDIFKFLIALISERITTKPWVRFLCIYNTLFQAETQSDSIEDLYVPSTIIFQENYGNSLSTATEEDVSTTTIAEEDYNIKQTQFVEFHPLITEKPTQLPPKYIAFNMPASTVLSTTSTTEDPEDIIKVVPVKKHYQRGLLDLLFPPRRVKSFKNVFDSIRRVLSHTFRR